MTGIFIYGSCVSRDTFEYVDKSTYSLVNYVARQSLASAFSPADPGRMPDTTKLVSDFQRRMYCGDWIGDLHAQLARTRSRTDGLVWDLCDERLGVFVLPGGEVVTRSVESIAAGLDHSMPAGTEHLPFGTPRHRELFERRCADFAEALTSHRLVETTVVLAPSWAEVCDDGEPTPTSFGLKASTANESFEPYLACIESSVGLPIVRLAAGDVVGASNHKWGRAPFHYESAVYQSLAASIEAHIAQLTA